MVEIPMVGYLGIAKAISTAPPTTADSASLAPTAEQCTSWIPRVIRPRSGISNAETDGCEPEFGSLVMDQQGSLYGTTSFGGDLSVTNPACLEFLGLRHCLQTHALSASVRISHERGGPNAGSASRASPHSDLTIVTRLLPPPLTE